MREISRIKFYRIAKSFQSYTTNGSYCLLYLKFIVYNDLDKRCLYKRK